MIRGFSTSRDVVPNFLQSFDADDGRLPCPLRTRTVTAPQGLFLMNSPEIDKASEKLVERQLDYRTGVVYTTNRRVWEHDETFKEYLRRTRCMAVDMETATIFAAGLIPILL